MTTSYPSGLGSSFGITAEATVGTFITTSMRWPKINKESFALNKGTAQSNGLHQSSMQEAKRRAFVQRDVQGAVSLDLADKGMGLIFKHMLGSVATATQISSSTAYTQNHYLGDTRTLSTSIQIGRPQTNGTIQQFNVPGAKISDWAIGVQKAGLATLDLTFDAWDVQTSTSYAAPTFVAADVFDFHQGAVLLGGTPSTTSNLTTISGGSAPTGLISSFNIKGTNAMNTQRFGLGSRTKSEQLLNGFRAITGDFELEFANLTDVFTTDYLADMSTALEFTLTGNDAGSSNPYTVDVVLPAVFIETGDPMVDGPDIITQKCTFTVLDNLADNPISIKYVSTDTAI